jgi:cytochrome c553
MTADGAAATAFVAMTLVIAGGGCAGAAGDRELGEYLSAECVTCHQLSGKFDGIPPIIGWPPESFVAILTDYRERRRENQVMRSIAVKFSDEEIAALAAYFGSLKPAAE